MELFTWDDRYCVNIGRMDEQHKRFFHYLFRMQQAVLKKEGEKAVSQTLQDLAEYANRHFHDEEDLLRTISYPDIDVQRRQHRYFRTQVEAMKKAYLDASAIPPITVLNFLAEWFVHHIIDEDKKYGTYLATKG